MVNVVVAIAIGCLLQARAGQPAAAPDGLQESLDRARLLAPQVTITRDQWGVAHVAAPTDAGAVFGGMYARAEDEMSRIEVSHAQAIGLASLLHGEEGVNWDHFTLSFEVPARARREHEAAPADVRAITQAAADALNLYVHLHPEYQSRAIECWEPWMFHAREYSWALHHAQQEAERIVRETQAAADANTPAASQPQQPEESPDGSNAWALAPSRAASGGAMLYINPHIPLDEPYELHLRSDEGLNISGMVAYGAGLLPMAGFNQHLGWTLTVNYVDIADAYAIEFDVPNDALAYRHGDQIRHAQTWNVTVPVRTAAGIEQRELRCGKTHHGPIIYRIGARSFAVRAARIEGLRAIEQWYRMAKAQNKQQWLDAVAIGGVVFHNLVYADDAGNIGYLYNATFPRRDPQFDWKGTLDGHDPRSDWLGYHSLSEVPQVWNPPGGYLLNCNSSPFNVTAAGENPDASAFPAYMIGNDLADGRVAMSHAIISTARAWTLDDLERSAFDTKVYAVDYSRGPLLADFDKWRGQDPEHSARMREAIELIRGWNGCLVLDSVASTLFCEWLEKAYGPAWRERRDEGDLCAALDEVIDDLQRDFGDWRVPWGEINRHQRFDSHADAAVSDARESLPIVGGHGGMGVSFCYLARRGEDTKKRYGYHGHSYVAAVEFTPDAPPQARSIIPFGNARDPRSPHYNDQAPLYASGQMKAALFITADVNAGARRTYHPGD